jgi:DNA-directed RNA polymerase sigma subunit (sigma70/sigma32)
MAEDSKQRALHDARRAQATFEKTREQMARHGRDRQERFQRAKETGATLREIGEAVGLHWTRIREIVSGR